MLKTDNCPVCQLQNKIHRPIAELQAVHPLTDSTGGNWRITIETTKPLMVVKLLEEHLKDDSYEEMEILVENIGGNPDEESS